MRNLGPMEIVAILAVVILLFGSKKIPELMKGLGEGLKSFRHANKEAAEALKETKL